MKKIIIAPDSFKGSLSSEKFCEIAKSEIKNIFNDCKILTLPIADGGEGTLDCIQTASGGKIYKIITENPFFEKITAKILMLKDKKTFIVETAQAVGLPKISGRENPELTTTYGIGRLIEYAAELGAKEIILALGGSSTNDCGAGMLSRLGINFFDDKGQKFIPTGKTLVKVKKIGVEEKFAMYKGIHFKAMCDVNNPLYGERGCSHVFAAQKGADKDMIKRLENGVQSFAAVVSNYIGQDYSFFPGCGAAGGLGFACKTFLAGELVSGINTLLDIYDFDGVINGADLIITGEGCFDGQSLMGKAVGGIVARAKYIPVAVFCGKYNPFDYSAYKNIKAVVPISKNQDLQTALLNAESNLRENLKKYLYSSH